MQSLFTERNAVELAYKNLEDAKIKRREEMRADLEKIDAREQHILERLQVLDKEQPVPAPEYRPLTGHDIAGGFITGDKIRNGMEPPQNNFPIYGKDVPHPNQLAGDAIAAGQAERKQPKAPAKNNRNQKPKQITEAEGAAILIEILGAAAEPLSAKQIGEKFEAKTGRKYASIHDSLKRWTAKSGGKVQKIGTKYSIR